MMEPNQVDNCLYKLQKIYAIHSKKVHKDAVDIWRDLFCQYEEQDVMEALKNLTLSLSREPRTKEFHDEIQKIVKPVKEPVAYKGDSEETRRAYESDKYPKEPASDEISAAWLSYSLITCGKTFNGQYPKISLSREDVLIIVNQQAKKHGFPDVILPEHRIAEIWNDQNENDYEF